MMSPWKGLEKFLQGDWAVISLDCHGNMELCWPFPSWRKALITLCTCSELRGIRIHAQECKNIKIALHLLKIFIQYLLSLQSYQKAVTGIFSLQKRTLKFKESHILPEATLLPSFKVRICTRDPTWIPSLFNFLTTFYLHISVNYGSKPKWKEYGLQLTLSRSFLLIYFISFSIL